MSHKDLSHLYSQETTCAQPSAIREICALVARPEIVSLAGGWPDPAVFPQEILEEIFGQLMKEHGPKMLQYGSTEGLLELRELLAEKMAGEGAPTTPDNILITHGSAQGMMLGAQVFIERGDLVMLGLPTYFGGTGAILARGGEPVGIPVDAEGMNIKAMSRILDKDGDRIKGVYIVPTFQNPTGSTLTLERREELLYLAEKFDFVIFEDDPYRDLRYDGEPVPSLLALDKNQRVIHLRSLSKIFTPGFRLGWAVGEIDVIRQMAVAKQYFDAATNTPAQFLLWEYMRAGHLDRRIKENIKFYREKRDFMLEMMESSFPPEVSWNKPQGGYFIFVHLPEGIQTAEVFQEAAARNVAFITGQPFYVDGSGENTFRLSFSQAGKEDIELAIKTLGEILQAKV